MENTNSSKAMDFFKRLAVGGLALVGSIVGSVTIGMLGLIYVTVASPATIVEFERGAVLIGALVGSGGSIPVGLIAGGNVGFSLYDKLKNQNLQRPALHAAVWAFVIGAFVSGAVLVPLGFFLFGVGHI